MVRQWYLYCAETQSEPIWQLRGVGSLAKMRDEQQKEKEKGLTTKLRSHRI